MPSLSNFDLLASVSRDSFKDFVVGFWDEVPGAGKLVWGWHMEMLCDELETVARRVFAGKPKEYDLVINISPGTSKSTILSILFPLWTWTNMPQARHINASHTDTLVLDFANKARQVLRAEKYQACFPTIKLRDDQAGKAYYRNTLGGDRLTCTVGGKSPMGFHGHFLTVDDPIDPKKAVSELELKNAEDFMLNVLPSRKVDKEVSVTILIMQRLHENDPTGILLQKAKVEGAGRIKHICLPAELAENISPPELREMYVGGLMDPFRLPRSVLREYEITLGQYGYAGQFMQNPVPLGGGMFREEFFTQRVKAAPYDCKRVRYWDLASSTSQDACFSCGTLMSRSNDGHFFVEHVERFQAQPFERDRRILATAKRDKERYGPRHDPAIWIEQEPGSAGDSAFRYLAGRLAGFRVYADKVTGPKEVRAEGYSSQCAAGNVLLASDGTWDIPGWIHEHCLFPMAKLKDRVDSASGAFGKLTKPNLGAGLRVITGGCTGRDRERRVKTIVCSKADLAKLEVEEKCLLVSISDPHSKTNGSLPTHELSNLLGWTMLEFCDLDPADCQARWNEPISPWDKTPAELIMDKQEHGKKIWSLLTRYKDPAAEVWVFQDEGGQDRRAMSIALAVCDKVRLARPSAIFKNGDESWRTDDKTEPPNRHIYEVMKASRNMVIGDIVIGFGARSSDLGVGGWSRLAGFGGHF